MAAQALSRFGRNRHALSLPASQFADEGLVTRVEMMGPDQFVYLRLVDEFRTGNVDIEDVDFCVRVGPFANQRAGQHFTVLFNADVAPRFDKTGVAILQLRNTINVPEPITVPMVAPQAGTCSHRHIMLTCLGRCHNQMTAFTCPTIMHG